ncbi:hypothetical protein [Candidatus Avelusimicrobium faecicola]|uniref:hypothetical protein n=1 Tax=Candidatus Avelusimicrobium faecicola TaxID=3416205 RepID=UPI003D0CA867
MPEYKYAKVKNEETKVCDVGIGTNDAFYESLGFTKREVEQSYMGEWYLKGYAPSKPEPTTAEKVQVLEQATGLTRAVRELVLADGSGASDYVRAKAQEIEALANPLRGGPEVSAPAEPQTEEGL